MAEKPDWWTPEMQHEWETWVASRPPIIQDLARQFPPYIEWVIGESSDYYILYSYCEDGTLSVVRMSAKTNEPRWRVFGLEPGDLRPRSKSEVKRD